MRAGGPQPRFPSGPAPTHHGPVASSPSRLQCVPSAAGNAESPGCRLWCLCCWAPASPALRLRGRHASEPQRTCRPWSGTGVRVRRCSCSGQQAEEVKAQSTGRAGEGASSPQAAGFLPAGRPQHPAQERREGAGHPRVESGVPRR